MKKNIENETVNVVMEPIMNAEEMKAFVEQNKHLVPRNQVQKFNVLTLEKQVSKISFYLDMQKMREDAKERNKIINRVKELFNKRHASVDDAKDVLGFCSEFITNYRQRELDKLDAEIARLEELKLQLNG